jgi:hypothetical protein
VHYGRIVATPAGAGQPKELEEPWPGSMIKTRRQRSFQRRFGHSADAPAMPSSRCRMSAHTISKAVSLPSDIL